jgi:hypothetical protein
MHLACLYYQIHEMVAGHLQVLDISVINDSSGIDSGRMHK